MSDVLSEVVHILTDVVGEDFLLDTEITRDTTFSDDLALESIEFVALAEALQERYGDRVSLIAFLGEKDVNAIMAMTVGELTDYIEATVAQATPAGPR